MKQIGRERNVGIIVLPAMDGILRYIERSGRPLSGGQSEIEDNSMAKHVHQKHNNVSIKIELVTNKAPGRWVMMNRTSRFGARKLSAHFTNWAPRLSQTNIKFPPDIFRTLEDYPIKDWVDWTARWKPRKRVEYGVGWREGERLIEWKLPLSINDGVHRLTFGT